MVLSHTIQVDVTLWCKLPDTWSRLLLFAYSMLGKYFVRNNLSVLAEKLMIVLWRWSACYSRLCYVNLHRGVAGSNLLVIFAFCRFLEQAAVVVALNDKRMDPINFIFPVIQ